jgi:hypothetical protein
MCPVCGSFDGIAVDEDNIYGGNDEVIGYVVEVRCEEPGCDGVWQEESYNR